MFKYRKLWGVYIGQFAVTSCQWFFLTWFPTYLIEFRHLSFVKTGLYASVPFLAAFVGVLLSGFVSDRVLRRGYSLGVARKTPIICGLLLSSSIIGANYVEAPELVIAFMALAFFGNGLASIGWSLISSVAPRRLIGLTGGTFNFISNLSGITTPLIIGYLAQGGNFAPGLTYIATVAVIGALAYILMIGKVERVEDSQVVTLNASANRGRGLMRGEVHQIPRRHDDVLAVLPLVNRIRARFKLADETLQRLVRIQRIVAHARNSNSRVRSFVAVA